jgi:hypothetical protein
MVATFPGPSLPAASIARLISKSFRVNILATLLGLFLTLQPGFAPAQTPVTTWHYNNTRNAVNTTETVLTPANVNIKTFGKLYTQTLDELVVGHPLYLPQLSIPGNGVHNVVFVATMSDTVYAFDADNPSAPPLWTTSLLTYSPALATPVADKFPGCQVTTDFTNVGVVSTPVIDPTTNTIYLVAETWEKQKAVHRLHALDVTTGLEKLGGPTTITATYTLNGTTNTFVDLHQMNRPGLLLANGNIYIGFGSAGCNGPESGWIMSYNATTLAQNGVLDIEPGSNFAAIWQKGGGLSVDNAGYIYAESGEGAVGAPGFGTPGQNLGTSVFKVAQVGNTLQVADWFTPYNWQYMFQNDLDLHNAVLILPDQPGAHPHELVAIGKEGTIYLLDRDNMGGLCASCTAGDTQIVQELLLAVGKGSGTPLLWNNSVYFTGNHVITAYPLVNGMLGTPVVSDEFTGGGHPLLTANGTSNAIIWSASAGLIWAVDPTTLQVLWTTNQAPQNRDLLTETAHFATPVVADGKLFIGARRALIVYGILPVLSAVTGNNQTGGSAAMLPTALTAQALDKTGAPIPGLAITFSDGNKGGIFNPASGTTDSNGQISTIYTLPKKAGTFTITGSATGWAPAIFTEIVQSATATKIVRFTGTAQTAAMMTPLAAPFVGKVQDVNNNGVAGVSVTFSDNGKGGTFSANPVVSDSTGSVSVNYTTGSVAGNMSIAATSGTLTPANFFITVTPNPASAIVIQSGNNQKAHVSTALIKPLQAKVTDNYGNPIGGITVNFTDNGAGGTFSATSVTTATTGLAPVNYTTPPTTGTVTVTASSPSFSGTTNFTVIVQ